MVNVKVKGPRLNQTKVERASVVYGKDHRLHWRVTPPMPKLLVRMYTVYKLFVLHVILCTRDVLTVPVTFYFISLSLPPSLSPSLSLSLPPSQACLTHVPTSLLSGEVCRVGVEIYNVGQVALNSLRITSSLGHQLLLEMVSHTCTCQIALCMYPPPPPPPPPKKRNAHVIDVN